MKRGPSNSSSSISGSSRILAALDQGYQASFTPSGAYTLPVNLRSKRKRSGTLDALTGTLGDPKRRVSSDYESGSDEGIYWIFVSMNDFAHYNHFLEGESDSFRNESRSSSSPAPPRIKVFPGSQMSFHLHYDSETPLRPIDIGGHDQAEKCVFSVFMLFFQLMRIFRMAEFVSNAIENLSDGVTVTDAMESLGLRRYV
jgi:hypothetical protein